MNPCRTLFAVVLLLWAVVPSQALAHGELHLQIMALTRQIAASTNRAELYARRGELLREHGELEAAEADFSQAALLDPNLAAVDFGRARLMLEKGELEKARAFFDKGLGRSPRDGLALADRAKVFLGLGRTNEAIADLQLGVDVLLDPAPEYYLELARLLAATGQVEKAVIALDRGDEKISPGVKLHAYALDLEIGSGKTNAALARLNKILELAMRKENWWARRGELLLGQGKVTEARKAFEASLAAIDRLPSRLQESPGMVELKASVKKQLENLRD